MAHHIKSLHLYVKVAWVGKRLEQVISTMEKLVDSSKSKRSFVILTWTPSVFTVPGDKRFITVSFPPCETYALSTGCKYDLHRLVKVMWQPLVEAAKPIYDVSKIFILFIINLLEYNTKIQVKKMLF